MCICSRETDISLNLCINDLTDDVLVGDTNDESVLGRIVLVLGLSDKSLASIVIRLSFYSFLERSDLPLRRRYLVWNRLK